MASRYNSIAAAAAGASALLQAAAILLDLGVKPSVSSTYRETRLRWHRTGFCSFWRWKSRRPAGRPAVAAAIRNLIRRISQENMVRRCGPPSQGGRPSFAIALQTSLLSIYSLSRKLKALLTRVVSIAGVVPHSVCARYCSPHAIPNIQVVLFFSFCHEV
jgi:hypothetical protein